MKNIFIMTLFLFVLSSCLEDKGEKGTGVPFSRLKDVVNESKVEWTIAVYVNADNNLSATFLSDLIEMNSATINGKNVNIIAIVDFDSSREIPNSSSYFPSGTGVYKIVGNNKEPILLKSENEENFDNPNVLTKHLTYVFQKFPAKKRGLIMWDHGGSWDGGFGGDSQNGTIQYPATLSIAQIKSALSDVALSLNFKEKPFDFLDFDTCLMGNLESIYEFKNITKFYSASAEIDFGRGHDYKKFFSILSNNPTKGMADLAPDIIQSWDDHHKNAGVSDRYLRTKTIVDTSTLNNLADDFNGLISILISSLYNNDLTFVDFLKKLSHSSPGFGSSLDSGEFGSEHTSYRDVGHITSMLTNTNTQDINEAANSLRTSFLGAIKAKSLGDIRVGNQFGLSIESSLGSDWTNSKREKYSKLQWSYDTYWMGILDIIAAEYNLDIGAPTLSTSIANGVNPSAINKPRISFSTVDSDVDRARAYSFEVDSNGNVFALGFVGHGFVENGHSYNFDWSGKRMTLTNGTQTSIVALDLLSLPGKNSNGDVVGGFFKVKGKLIDGANVYACELIGQGSELSDIIIYIPRENGVQSSALSISDLAGLGLSFVPQLTRISSSGTGTVQTQVDQVPIPLTSGVTTLELDNSVSAPAGSYLLGIILTDVWGKSSTDIESLTIVTPF